MHVRGGTTGRADPQIHTSPSQALAAASAGTQAHVAGHGGQPPARSCVAAPTAIGNGRVLAGRGRRRRSHGVALGAVCGRRRKGGLAVSAAQLGGSAGDAERPNNNCASSLIDLRGTQGPPGKPHVLWREGAVSKGGQPPAGPHRGR